MTKGPGRFEFWLVKLEEQLLQALKNENPALFLYQNDARTKLFMLEGLSRLYAGLHNKKLFCKLEKQFKSLEDLLGTVDYYDAFAKDFLADPEMPLTVRMAMEQRRDEKLAEINTILKKKRWLTRDLKRTKKIRKKLLKADWKKPQKETELFGEFYAGSVKKIDAFYAATGDQFTNLESQVHDLRRKLRWLSIYPQALQGAIQLADNNTTDEATAKYLTPEIVNSPFNKLPAQGSNESVFLLEKKYFLALSYMISALGKLKDAGLRIIATAEGIQITQFVPPDIAMNRAFELNKTDNKGLENIMARAKELCRPYFENRLLEKIIAAAGEKESIPAPATATAKP